MWSAFSKVQQRVPGRICAPINAPATARYSIHAIILKNQIYYSSVIKLAVCSDIYSPLASDHNFSDWMPAYFSPWNEIMVWYHGTKTLMCRDDGELHILHQSSYLTCILSALCFTTPNHVDDSYFPLNSSHTESVCCEVMWVNSSYATETLTSGRRFVSAQLNLYAWTWCGGAQHIKLITPGRQQHHL